MFNVKRDPGDLIAVHRDSTIPLVAQLHDQLAWLIASRVIEADTSLPPIRSLADRVGVNLHTVRAAYRSLAEEGLVEMQRGRGTTVQPSSAWRSAGRKGPPTSTIGVIIPGHSPFYGPFLAGVEGGSSAAGLSFVCDAGENPERGRRYVDQLVAKGVDGIIVAGPMVPLEVITQLLDRGLPIVTADYPGAPGAGVDFDLTAAGAAAAEHLIGHGHRRIGIVTPPTTLPNVAPRVEGYRRALLDGDLVSDSDLIGEVGDWSADAGARGVEALLNLREPPTAIVTIADTLAAGIVRASRSRGVSVPNDLALVSIDGSTLGGLTDPPLTSVHLSAYDLGQQAVEALVRTRDGDHVGTERRTLPVDLVLRRSCGCSES